MKTRSFILYLLCLSIILPACTKGLPSSLVFDGTTLEQSKKKRGPGETFDTYMYRGENGQVTVANITEEDVINSYVSLMKLGLESKGMEIDTFDPDQPLIIAHNDKLEIVLTVGEVGNQERPVYYTHRRNDPDLSAEEVISALQNMSE